MEQLQILKLIRNENGDFGLKLGKPSVVWHKWGPKWAIWYLNYIGYRRKKQYEASILINIVELDYIRGLCIPYIPKWFKKRPFLLVGCILNVKRVQNEKYEIHFGKTPLCKIIREDVKNNSGGGIGDDSTDTIRGFLVQQSSLLPPAEPNHKE